VPDRYFDYQIPPLSLQLLIENAIKHNAFSDDMPLYIKVYIDEAEHLTVSNNLQLKKHPEISTKLGLQNINDRYKLLLDKRIEVAVTDGSFTVNLPIVKNESSNH
jgi:LytS/YehU family sensor histidine kinase